jgi:hypothetical protein
MFGDAFGGSPLLVTIPRPGLVASSISQRLGGFFVGIDHDPTVRATFATANQATFTTPANTTSFGQPVTTNFVASGAAQATSITQPGGQPYLGVVPLQSNPQDAAGILAQAVRQFGPGGTLVYVTDPNFSGAYLVSANTANIATAYDYVRAGPPVPQPPILVSVPTPTGGGVVGRTKISDDNSPLPRDRVIFDYDYFSSVPFTPGGFNVSRFSVGFEKTFLCQRTSVEVRMPFASTLDNNISADGVTNRATALGNLNVTLKVLVIPGDCFSVAGGLGIDVPTADDTHVFVGGSEVVRLTNNATVLTPYVAFLYTPNPSWFFQNWYQIGIPIAGNGVLFNDGTGTGLVPVGRLTDQNLVQIDAQLGYWLIEPNTSCVGPLSGLAPFVELHYNTVTNHADHVAAGNFLVGAVDNSFNELNLSVGAIVQFGDRMNLTLGASFPLLSSPNKTFDYQLGIRASIFFGPTYDSRSNASLVSSF